MQAADRWVASWLPADMYRSNIMVRTASRMLEPWLPAGSCPAGAVLGLAAGCLAALVLAALLAVVAVVRRSRARAKARGIGSGENNWWNRRINMNRPRHAHTHHKLAQAWVYEGAGAVADDAKKRGPLGTITARDHATGAPLSGHLIGRHTWRPAHRTGFKRVQVRGSASAA
jgi:hypothetical protein